jgi:hypothetical protein
MTAYGRDNLIGTTEGTGLAARLSETRVQNAMLIAATVAALLCYLGLSTQTSTKSFQIRAMDKKISDLEEARQKLDLQVVAGQSMDAVDGKIQGLGFVPVNGVDYVTPPGGYVAVK